MIIGYNIIYDDEKKMLTEMTHEYIYCHDVQQYAYYPQITT